MCRHCESILGTLSLPHPDHKCPLRQSQFCSDCSVFGHLADKCPEKKGKRLLVLPSDSEIRKTLQSLGITLKKGQSAKTVLKQYAKEKELRLVYLPTPTSFT